MKKNKEIILPPTYSIVLYGDNRVGTTSLIRRYIYGNYNPNFYNNGVDNYYKNIILDDGKEVKIHFVDIYNYRGFYYKIFLKKANGIMLTYDKTNRRSFENIESRINEIEKDLNPNTPISLIGCKEDLYIDEEVTTEEGENLANEFGLFFYETSAKENVNVNECFNDFINRINQMNQNDINNVFNLIRERLPKRGCLK